MAQHPQLERPARHRLSPKGMVVVTRYSEPAEGSTSVCTDETGPVVPRSFDHAPDWSADGHRKKAPLVYGSLRVRDGKALTRSAASRNSRGYSALLADIEADNPTGDIFIITDNISSPSSLETRTSLEDHPRIHHVFIPTGAC